MVMAGERNVYQRLAAVMERVSYIQKERKQGMQYTIVSHDAVTAKVRPALLAEGIVYHPIRCEHTHNGNRAECAMTVRFVNVDNPEDFFDVPTFGYGIDSQDKGPGKAMSYAVKYALLKALGLETGDDADNESIPHETQDEIDAKQFLKSVEIEHANITGVNTLNDLRALWERLPSALQKHPKIAEAKEARKAALTNTQEKAA
jgi:hypothetical protein